MFDSDKDYWLYIVPHVYCNMKENQALLYNTLSGDCMEVAGQEVMALLKSLHEKKNLGCIHCRGMQLNLSPVREFVSEFCRKDMGGVADLSRVPEKPIQLMPVLNLQYDMEKLKTQDERSIGEDLLKYLLGLNIYLNSECHQQCPHCKHYFRQNICCTTFSGKKPQALDLCVLQNVLEQIRYGLVGQLNLLGGNLFNYPYYEELSDLLIPFAGRTHFWNHYTAFSFHKRFISDFIQDIVVTFPLQEDEWRHCVTLLEHLDARYHFFIIDEEEYKEAVCLIEKYGIKKYAFHPTYTGDNNVFFEKYVFLNRSDIFDKKLSFRQIFAHQKMNTHFFGILTVSANGEVYSNVNNIALGNIADSNLLDLIGKEMTENLSWRKIREKQPCCDCLYQYLCPSPSNYEIVMNKQNLCHIKL